ncbi:phosphoglycerate mutase [Synergistales bacterium]|nr:phosphoglycerate mutase [Synergistales bacterium]
MSSFSCQREILKDKKILDKKIIIVRHGRTAWNDALRFQGRSDVPLNELGRAQAEKTAKRLASCSLDAIYTSPLTRARQTAEAIASYQTNKTPIVIDEFTEANFGKWEGEYIPGLKERCAETLNRWLEDPFFNMPSDAETWDALEARVSNGLDIILSSEHESVAIISHGGAIRVIYALLLGFDPHTIWRVRLGNCCMSGVRIKNNKISLDFVNDRFHLRDDFPLGATLPVW